MTTPQVHRCMIVPADQVDLARSICATLAPSGGFAMFNVGLSPTGQAPATHYVSTGYIDEDFAELMPLTWWEQDEQGAWYEYDEFNGAPWAVAQMCTAAGFEITEAEVVALFAESDVTEQEPFAAFARLGLAMVQPDETPA